MLVEYCRFGIMAYWDNYNDTMRLSNLKHKQYQPLKIPLIEDHVMRPPMQMARLPTSPCNTIYDGQKFCATEEGPTCTLEIKNTNSSPDIHNMTPFNLIKMITLIQNITNLIQNNEDITFY